MSMSTREKVLGAATLCVIAFGLVGTQARSRLEVIASKTRAARDLDNKISIQKELIGAAQDWSARYDKVKDQMPVFEQGLQVATYWLNIMDLAAEQYGVKIRDRSAKDETINSDVCEFPIEVREWEATLESFLQFVHAIQSEGAMLDIRELKVSPIPNRPGILKGSFVLYCAYMRGTPPPGSVRPSASSSPVKTAIPSASATNTVAQTKEPTPPNTASNTPLPSAKQEPPE